MKRKRHGFTLLELVIALAITVIIIGIAASMFITGNKVFSDSDVKSTLQIEGQDIQEEISNIGMQGIEVISESPLKIESYIKKDDKPRYFLIKREDRSKETNGNFVVERYSDSTYSVLENRKIISENLKIFNAEYSNDGKSIDFYILLSNKKGFSDVEHEMTFTINLRNKSN